MIGQGIAATLTASIRDIDTGIVPLGMAVSVEGAIVTAVGSDRVWIQDPTSVGYGGIVGYLGSGGTAPSGVVPGAVVTVTGTTAMFDGLAEIVTPSFTVTETSPRSRARSVRSTTSVRIAPGAR